MEIKDEKAAEVLRKRMKPGMVLHDVSRDVLEAALSSSPAGVVKPLEWKDNTKGGCFADTQLGCYAAIWNGGKFYQACFNGVTVDHESHKTLEAAKSAAFADYSARIMSAIEPAAPQCCMCGKKGLSTVEGDGGTECELTDGRWVCSAECWEQAVEPAGVGVETEHALYRFLVEGDVIRADDEFMSDDGATWVEPSGWEVGMEYPSKLFKSARRLVRTALKGDE